MESTNKVSDYSTQDNCKPSATCWSCPQGKCPRVEFQQQKYQYTELESCREIYGTHLHTTKTGENVDTELLTTGNCNNEMLSREMLHNKFPCTIRCKDPSRDCTTVSASDTMCLDDVFSDTSAETHLESNVAEDPCSRNLHMKGYLDLKAFPSKYIKSITSDRMEEEPDDSDVSIQRNIEATNKHQPVCNVDVSNNPENYNGEDMDYAETVKDVDSSDGHEKDKFKKLGKTWKTLTHLLQSYALEPGKLKTIEEHEIIPSKRIKCEENIRAGGDGLKLMLQTDTNSKPDKAQPSRRAPKLVCTFKQPVQRQTRRLRLRKGNLTRVQSRSTLDDENLHMRTDEEQVALNIEARDSDLLHSETLAKNADILESIKNPPITSSNKDNKSNLNNDEKLESKATMNNSISDCLTSNENELNSQYDLMSMEADEDILKFIDDYLNN